MYSFVATPFLFRRAFRSLAIFSTSCETSLPCFVSLVQADTPRGPLADSRRVSSNEERLLCCLQLGYPRFELFPAEWLFILNGHLITS